MAPLLRDIPQFISGGNYAVNVSWSYLLQHVERAQEEKPGLDLDPDFQRAHVWTEAQQIAYVEYALRGGQSGRDLWFNCAGWFADWRGPYVIVDGKQRLEAVRRFLVGEIPAFGHRLSEYADKLPPMEPAFLWHVNNLPARAEVLEWYLQLNSGGTVHTEDELSRVRHLLKEEKGASQ